MSEQESGSPVQKGSEGGAGNADGHRRRRRNRGNRRPDQRGNREGTAATEQASDAPVANAASTPREQTPAPAKAPVKSPTQTPAKAQHPTSAPAPNGTPAQDSGEPAKQSRRNKRRRPDRKSNGQSADPSATESTTATAPAAVDAKKGETQKPDAQKQHLAKPTGGKQLAKQSRKEKAEKDSPGSVLQRRLTREAKEREEHEADELLPAPPPTKINSVDAYVSQLRGWQREVVNKLRQLIKTQAPEVKEGIMWSQPVYSGNGPVVYLKAFSDHVNMGFWRGNEISDSASRLVGDLPTMRHVTIRHVNEVDAELFAGYIREAVKLDRDKGDATA
ncbi:MAG: DUF1801 domain-containing protein [Bradyrhizobiaceae bacterium]|nr:DUF1801 domain-containing protein [Bradyrhizobiaceae bacterium]